jgi:hypothetical protein
MILLNNSMILHKLTLNMNTSISMAATHSLVSEEEFFDALEYFEVADIVDDIIDT